MPFSENRSETTEKNPLQAQNQTGIKSIFSAILFGCAWKRASVSVSHRRARGSMTVEAAVLMSFFLLSIHLLFYFFYLMEFQIELQFAMERKVHEAVAVRPDNPPGISLLQSSVRRELLGEGKGLLTGKGGVRLSYNEAEGSEFLDVTAVFEASPAVRIFGPLRGTYVRRCRRRLWTGQDSIRGRGTETEGDEEEYVYVTWNGTVYHKSRSCSYLRPSVHAAAFQNVSELRSDDGSRYYPCERCMKGDGSPQTVYVTDYGNRYHGSKSCGSLNRWVMKVPVGETGGRPPCSKCGGR